MYKPEGAPWQTSWSIFIDDLARSLRGNENASTLADLFGGRSIEWSGVLVGKRIEPMAPSVNLALPEEQIDFGDGRIATLKSISLPIAESAIVEWQQIPEGTKVAFSALLGSGASPFPPIEITNLRSGKTIVMIRLSEGIPVKSF